jgi:benzil reductase ((S)-benzoin forming)
MRSTIITGVSRGLGAALFDELLAAGDRVMALGRRFTADQLQKAQSEPERVALRPTDLADFSALPNPTELASFVGGSPGEVALVHNAAVFEPYGRIGMLEPERVASAVAVNLTAAMLLTNALFGSVLSELQPQLRGRTISVLFISSGAAHRIAGGRSVYASTKRAAETFLESLAAEWAPDPRVRVAIVDPGMMDTEMQAVVRKHAREDSYFPDRQHFLDRYERGDIPSPVDVARRIMREHFRATD